MPWGLAAAAVGGAASLIGGSMQSSAVSKGQASANAALAAGKTAANTALSPYASTGQTANTALANIEGLNGTTAATNAMANFTASPSYQYQLTEGLKGVDAGAASKGLLSSGQTIKAEQTLGNNLASTDFGNYISRLNSLSTSGLSAAQSQATADTTTASGQASTANTAATNQASITGSEVKGVSSAITGALTNSGVQNSLTSMFGSTTPEFQ